ncbi:MAG: PKD domain-containing protein [Candidatus Thermoplasmatota archaeon]
MKQIYLKKMIICWMTLIFLAAYAMPGVAAADKPIANNEKEDLECEIDGPTQGIVGENYTFTVVKSDIQNHRKYKWIANVSVENCIYKNVTNSPLSLEKGNWSSMEVELWRLQEWSYSKSFTMQWDKPGKYMVCARVKNDAKEYKATEWDIHNITIKKEVALETNIQMESNDVEINEKETMYITGEKINFEVIVNNGSSPYGYSWSFGDGTSSEEKNPVHVFHKPGSYQIEVTVTDDEGNTDTTVKTIMVKDDHPRILAVNGGKGIKATIKPDKLPVEWSIHIDGAILGEQQQGEIPREVTGNISSTFLAVGKITITISANDIIKQYRGFSLGSYIFNIQKI